VSAKFKYLPTTVRGRVKPSARDFGLTRPSLFGFSNVATTRDTGKFTVTADLRHTVAWETWADVGPSNQANITSASDATLTSTNYSQAAKDLTPDMSKLGGVPPRKNFWSKDLTERHEKYHVKDHVDIAKEGAAGAEKWLAGQQAAKRSDVSALLDIAWCEQIDKVEKKFMASPASEVRAYSDGASSYKARADAIKAKGDAGSYPPK